MTEQYVNPPVTVSVVAIRNGGVLLGRKGTHWDLPGGFLEVGETLEEAANREFLEETGHLLRGVKYLESRVSQYSDGRKILCVWFLATAIAFNVKRIDIPAEQQKEPELSELCWFAELPKNVYSISDRQLLEERLQSLKEQPCICLDGEST